MRKLLCVVFLTVLVLGACGSENAISPDEGNSGIVGQVYLGPTQPVCVASDPCVAPFAATFHVFSGDVEVATFRTGSDGKFRLTIAPGDYLVVPDEDAPILSARTQTIKVTVPEGKFVIVRWDFDTGIV